MTIIDIVSLNDLMHLLPELQTQDIGTSGPVLVIMDRYTLDLLMDIEEPSGRQWWEGGYLR